MELSGRLCSRCSRLRARASFRQQCVPTRSAIVAQWQRQWERTNRARVREVDACGQVSWSKWLDRSCMPAFECTDAELAETQHAFLSIWDGKACSLPNTILPCLHVLC